MTKEDIIIMAKFNTFAGVSSLMLYALSHGLSFTVEEAVNIIEGKKND